MKSLLTVCMVCVLGLLVASAGAATSFDDQFTGTAADPDAAKWSPNDDGAYFDAYLQDDALHIDCSPGGGGGNGSGLFLAGPLGKQSVERVAGNETIWTWETLAMTAQPDLGVGMPNGNRPWNDAFSDVLITPYAPPALWNNNNPGGLASANYVGCRVGRYDGVVTLMQYNDNSQTLNHSFVVDGRLPGVWTMTFPADLSADPVTIEVDQGSGPVLVHSIVIQAGNNVNATEQYPMFREYNQGDWSPYTAPWDSEVVYDYINGVSIPEPVTLMLLAAGGLLIRRKK